MIEYKIKDFTKDSFIHIFKSKEKHNKIAHMHDFVEFVYILSGNATLIINDCKFDVHHGNIIFINYKNQHAFEIKDELEYINICLDMDFFSNILYKESRDSVISLKGLDELKKFNIEKLFFQGEERKEIETLLFGMLKEYSQKPLLREKTLVDYMNILLNIILRKRSHDNVNESVDAEWSKIVEYIKANLSDELSLELIAKRYFYNPTYFSRIFKEKFNISVSKYITHKRIECAKILLKTTNMTIDAIAQEVGYKNRSSLYRAFLRAEGVSVSDYRGK